MEEEIDLRDYLRVIKQRKKGIIAIFIIVVALAFITNLFIPPTYESKALLKIGSLNKKPLETVHYIKTILQQKDNLSAISQLLNIDQQEVSGLTQDFDINEIKDTDLLEIRGRGKTPTESVAVTNAVKDVLLAHHQKLFSGSKEGLELDIKQVEQKIEENQAYINESQTRLVSLQLNQTELEQKINRIESTQSEAQAYIAVAYIESLNYIKGQALNEQNNLRLLDTQTLNLEKDLQNKKYISTYHTVMTRVEYPAYLPQQQISPNRKINVVIGAVLGLFIGILWAFAIEFFNKEKQDNSNSN